MDGRRGSPARLLAPISLVAFAIAFLLVIVGSDAPDDSNRPNAAAQSQRAGQTTTAEEQPRVSGRFYTVQTGDTLGSIAEQVGLSVQRLQELNPDLDPQALVSGQKIRLRE